MKKRFTTHTMVIVVLALLISTIAGALSLSVRQFDSARRGLRELLDLMDAQGEVTQPEHLTETFRAAMPEKRLTIVAPDGTVLADTDSDTTEDHQGRPEVQAALADGWGEITRGSATLGYPMLYVAKRFSDGVVVRAAMPMSTVDALVWNSLPPLVVAVLVALVMAFSLSRRMARQLAQPLNAVGQALQETLYGHEPTALAQYEQEAELRPILRYLQQLLDQLQSSLRQIKTERDKAKLILECMDEGLLLLDEGGHILAINRAARDLLGPPEHDAGGVPPLLRSKKVSGAIRSAREGHAGVVLDLSDPAPGERDLRLFISPVSGQRFEGQAVGASILISDVTTLKQAENIRSEFTANVSHELKTPLTSIRGTAELLSQGMVKPEDQKRFYTLISVETERLISLINDILELSELESVVIDQPSETASPLNVAREAQTLLRPEAEEKHIAVHVSGLAGDAAISPDRLKELLLNLMENAIRYGKEGGTVQVDITRAGQDMVIAVRDDGIGIPREAQAHIFERFYRVDKSRSKQTGGTGLGLAIVKHICRLYNGSVRVESELGRGSTFTVNLPIPRA